MIYILGIITGILLSIIAVLSVDKQRREEITKLVKREKGGIIETEIDEDFLKEILK